MRNLLGKVAVVTGAASGIGRALAALFAREGMRLVLADVESEALGRTAAELMKGGATVMAIPTDVSCAESVETLARETFAQYGSVHILCNNAGVGSPPGPLWERTLADWQWVFGVNVWGVVHGIRAFVPTMLKQMDEAHIVNTASLAGLLPVPLLGIYNASKHAVVSISENLHSELAMTGSRIGVSVLCPGEVQTRIMESERNRPPALAPSASALVHANVNNTPDWRTGRAAPMAPEMVAECVIEAIRENRLYVFTHPECTPQVRVRFERILGERSAAVKESREARLLRLGRAH